jgi:hypothetical protein
MSLPSTGCSLTRISALTAALLLLAGCSSTASGSAGGRGGEAVLGAIIFLPIYGIAYGIKAAASANQDYAFDEGKTIDLSPAVASKLQEYLEQRPTDSSFFYVSMDGQSGGYYIAGQGHDYGNASGRAKAQAKSACEVGAATECVMLFHQDIAKRRYM